MPSITVTSHPLLHRVLWLDCRSFFTCPRAEAVFALEQDLALANTAEAALAQLRPAEVDYFATGEDREFFNPPGVDASSVHHIMANYCPPGEE